MAPSDDAAGESSPVELRLQSSGDVAPGGEVGVTVSMNAPNGTRVAAIEVVYDPNVLTAQGTVTAPGRAAVSLAGADGQEVRSELRFRVSPSAPTGTTSVQIGSVSALGADGNPLPVAPPSPADIVIKP